MGQRQGRGGRHVVVGDGCLLEKAQADAQVLRFLLLSEKIGGINLWGGRRRLEGQKGNVISGNAKLKTIAHFDARLVHLEAIAAYLHLTGEREGHASAGEQAVVPDGELFGQAGLNPRSTRRRGRRARMAEVNHPIIHLVIKGLGKINSRLIFKPGRPLEN